MYYSEGMSSEITSTLTGELLAIRFAGHNDAGDRCACVEVGSIDNVFDLLARLRAGETFVTENDRWVLTEVELLAMADDGRLRFGTSGVGTFALGDGAMSRMMGL